MALNDASLKNNLKALYDQMITREDNPQQAREYFAQQMSQIISDYVRSASLFATPIQVTAAAMSNGGGPVVAANNLQITIA